MLETNPIYNRDLARIFSASVLRDLATQGESLVLNAVIKRIIDSNPSFTELSLLELYDIVYQYLCKEYRVEYVYKNLILQQILIQKHSISDSTMFTEFRAGKSIVDALILNSTSTAYEIKTEYDNTTRLNDQLTSYQMLFDEIYVVTHPSLIAEIESKVSSSIGLITVTEENELETLRDAKSNRSNTNPLEILYSLRKKEYVQIAETIIHDNLNIPEHSLFSFVKEIFSASDPTVIHDLAVEIIKKRTDPYSREVIQGIPDSIQMSFWELKIPKKHKVTLKAKFGR